MRGVGRDFYGFKEEQATSGKLMHSFRLQQMCEYLWVSTQIGSGKPVSLLLQKGWTNNHLAIQRTCKKIGQTIL